MHRKLREIESIMSKQKEMGGGGSPEGLAATEEEQAGEILWSFLTDLNLSVIFRAVAKTSHLLIKMIYCFGVFVVFFGVCRQPEY